MVLLMQTGSNAAILCQFSISPRSRVLGWFASFLMGIALSGFLISLRP
jgi:hypothetical protein